MSFDASRLPLIQMKLDQAWADSSANYAAQRFDPSLGTIQAILAQDTARIQNWFPRANGCLEGELVWLQRDTTAPSATTTTSGTPFTVPCEIDGNITSSVKDTFQIDQMNSESFKVPFSICDNIYENPELIIKGEVEIERKLTEAVSNNLLNFINTNIGDNQYPTLAEIPDAILQVDNTTNITTVAAGNVNWYDLIPALEEIVEFNRMPDFVMLDGRVLQREIILAQKANGTPTAQGPQGIYDPFLSRYFRDATRFRAQGLLDNLFMIERGAIHAQFRQMFDNPRTTPPVFGETRYFTRPAKWLKQADGSPAYFDVTYEVQKDPVAGQSGECEFYHVFNYRLRYGRKVAPSGIAGYTGIIKLERDPELAQVAVPMPKPSWEA